MSAFHDNALMGASGSQGYQISRSVRLRSSASAYFNRTNSSSPTNSIKWTWSGWVKRGSLGSQQNLVGATNSGSDDTYFNFNSSDKIVLGSYTGAGTDYGITTAAVFRDPSAWYHIVAVLDTANATSADRAIIYVNGVRQTVTNSANGMWPQNATNNKINTASQVVNIGRRSLGDSYLDGYLTEINFIDGQALTPSSFGETDAVTGVWKPKKYAGTYGTNGFYLNFSDNSATTATTIGKDYSGNGNNWTPNNISVTSGVTYDSMLDVPTQWADGGNGRGNYAVMNPLAKSSVGTLDNANMRWTCGNSGGGTAGNGTRVSIGINSGKWYAECTVLDTVFWSYPGISNESHSTSTYNGGDANSWSVSSSGQKVTNNSASAYGSATWAANDIVNIAYDADNGELYFGKNGTWLNSGNPATRTNPAFTGLSGTQFFTIGFSSNTASTSQVAFNCGQQPFSYTPPSGFKALNTFNLPEPTIKKGNQYFDVVTRTTSGTSGATISSLNFKPDLIWSKLRNSSSNHYLWDSVRGASKYIHSNLTNAEGTDATFLASFNSNGYTMGATEWGAGNSAVEWCLNAGSGTSSSNTNGSITSTVSANPTAGFSVVTWTGTGANATVGHGLGVAPKMMILANRGTTHDTIVYHASLPSASYRLYLNLTNAQDSGAATSFNSLAPTSSVINLGSNLYTNGNGYQMVAYCFAEVAGYSKFGSYTGNGSSDGVFVHLGFRARYLLIKETGNANSWEVYDTARNTSNVQTKRLFPNDSLAEATTDPSLDILSNGFKCRAGNTGINRSGGTYIFAAFAENPFSNALAR